MTEDKRNITGNVGEWSELYALAFILVKGGAYGADEEQNKKDDLFYKVLKIILEERVARQKMTYEIKDQIVDIFLDTEKIASVDSHKIQSILTRMFQKLSIKNEGRAFSLKSGSEMMELLQTKFISASRLEKKDLGLIILNDQTKLPTPELGFSIKSQLGGASTLINATGATNFVFEILDKDMSIPDQTPRLVNDSIRESMGLLQSSGYNIVFRHIDSETFSNNISLIDSNLQKYLAKILLSYYTGEASKFVDLINYNFPVDVPQNIQPVHKIKEFVSNMALGMMPTKVWDGIVTSLGGLILVKRDGDVLFYYLYNLKEFREYLINNTKFETGSRRRHKFGKIFKKDGHYFIKLNLQVRFIK